jgi:plasmanylethanolamine desaturase
MARIVQRSVEELGKASGGFRLFEVLCLLAFPMLATLLVYELRNAALAWPPLVPLAALIGFLGADLISGLAHWTFDTWGTPATPIVGRVFIRTFREHHVDPTAITRHDFVETNGSNAFGGCSLLCLGLYLGDDHPLTRASLVFMGFFVGATSQIHKWAHMVHPPRLVVWLQRWRLLLTPEHHATHHAAPFDRAYCITSGWLNSTLTRTHFFQVAERIISASTGALPRQDDIGKEAALEVALEQERQAQTHARPHSVD